MGSSIEERRNPLTDIRVGRRIFVLKGITGAVGLASAVALGCGSNTKSKTTDDLLSTPSQEETSIIAESTPIQTQESKPEIPIIAGWKRHESDLFHYAMDYDPSVYVPTAVNESVAVKIGNNSNYKFDRYEGQPA